MNINACMSSKYMDWETPLDFYNKLNEIYNFTLDFCATKENAKCERYYTKEQNALIQNPKDEIIFCNPPYGKDIKLFVKKCFELSNDNIIVMLIPARTDTKYFHEYILGKAKIVFIKGRLKFKVNSKGSGSAPFPSMYVVFGGFTE